MSGDRIVFAEEAFSAAFDQSVGLLRLHWNEVCSRKDVCAVDPDVELYRALERAGALVVVTARHAGQLVGYVVYVVRRHPHYRAVMVAEEDLHFLHPTFRRGSAGTRLIAAGEGAAVARAKAAGGEPGRIIVTARVKLAHDHRAIYRRMGYAEQDVTMTKAVG